MSTGQHGLNPLAESDLKRTAQSQQWREIGISAVAAAAHQASEKRPAEEAVAKVGGEPNRVVTLKDIDFLAA